MPVPAVIEAYEALRGALEAVLEPAGWQLLDGARVNESMENDYMLVGYGAEASGMSFERTRVGMGNRTDETLELRCLLSTLRGDEDMAARRARIDSGLALISAIVDLGRPLAGKVDRLAFGQGLDLFQEQNENGAVAELSFTLTAAILR